MIIKLKFKKGKEDNFLFILENLIFLHTNALISIEIQRLCKKFIKDLKECYFEP